MSLLIFLKCICSKCLLYVLSLCVSLCAPSQSGDGAGDPTVREDESSARGAAGAPHSDLPGTGCEHLFFNPIPPPKNTPHEMMGPHAQSSYGCIDNTQHNIHITIKDDSLGLSIHWA